MPWRQSQYRSIQRRRQHRQHKLHQATTTPSSKAAAQFIFDTCLCARARMVYLPHILSTDVKWIKVFGWPQVCVVCHICHDYAVAWKREQGEKDKRETRDKHWLGKIKEKGELISRSGEAMSARQCKWWVGVDEERREVEKEEEEKGILSSYYDLISLHALIYIADDSNDWILTPQLNCSLRTLNTLQKAY